MKVTLEDVVAADGIFTDGDWVESKDQDPKGDVRLIQLADIGEGTFLNKSSRYLTAEKSRELRCTYLKPGDLLIARMPDPIGRACLFPDGMQPSVTVVDICILRPDPKRVCRRWLMHKLNSHGFRRSIEAWLSGSTRQRISRGNLSKIEFSLPPLDEQRRIAAILDKADALCRKRQRVLELFDDLTKSLFLEMFRSYLDATPDTALGEFAEIQIGFPFKSSGYSGSSNDIRLCRGANVLPGRIDWSDLVRWPKARTDEFSEFNLSAGDIVIAMDRPWISSGFKAARISNDDLPSLLVQRVARIRPKEGADGDFLYALVRSSVFSGHFRPTETTVPHISPLEIKKFSIALPPAAMRERFARLCVKIHRQLAVATDDLTKRTSLSSSLQHRAFSGQL